MVGRLTMENDVYKRKPTSREAMEGVEPETQFGRMCRKLDIRIIAASSPQAKGRVERHHGTHQDRLIKKMRLEGIGDYEAANRYLDERYLEEHNAKFGCEAAAGANFHRRLSKRTDLKWVFVWRPSEWCSRDKRWRLVRSPRRNRRRGRSANRGWSRGRASRRRNTRGARR